MKTYFPACGVIEVYRRPMAAAWQTAWSWITTWASGLAWWQWGMLVGGMALVISGFFALNRARTIHDRAESTMTVPAALAAACAQLLVGYHLVIWTLPLSRGAGGGSGSGGVFVSAQWWWVVVLVAVGMVGLSMAIDRLEGRRG